MAKNAEIENLLKDCAKIGKSFIYAPQEDQDEEDKQFAYVQFVGKEEGRDVIFDTYISTLSQEYHMTVFDEADAVFFERHPELGDSDVVEMEEKYQVEYDQIVDKLYSDDTIKVSEELLIFEDEDVETPDRLTMEVFLNVRQVTESVIADFIKAFNAETFVPSDELFSFAGEGKE